MSDATVSREREGRKFVFGNVSFSDTIESLSRGSEGVVVHTCFVLEEELGEEY